MKSEEGFDDTDMVNMNSDKEKASSDANRSHEEGGLEMPKDPDAHLSPEEKAEVVSLPSDGMLSVSYEKLTPRS